MRGGGGKQGSRGAGGSGVGIWGMWGGVGWRERPLRQAQGELLPGKVIKAIKVIKVLRWQKVFLGFNYQLPMVEASGRALIVGLSGNIHSPSYAFTLYGNQAVSTRLKKQAHQHILCL